MENDLLIIELREQLKSLDTKLLALVGERLKLGRKIGALKAKKRLSLQDKTQEMIVSERFIHWAKNNHESEEMSKELALLLMKWTLEVQKNQKP